MLTNAKKNYLFVFEVDYRHSRRMSRNPYEERYQPMDMREVREDVCYGHGLLSVWLSQWVISKENWLAVNNLRYHDAVFQVTVHRVVNIVEKRSSMPPPAMEYDRGFIDDQWYGGPPHFLDGGQSHREGSYSNDNYGYFDDNPNYGRSGRNSSPPRQVRWAWKACFLINTALC